MYILYLYIYTTSNVYKNLQGARLSKKKLMVQYQKDIFPWLPLYALIQKGLNEWIGMICSKL